MQKCRIYLRVSSVGQYVKGFSLEQQELTCTKFAQEKGFVVDEVVKEVFSAFSVAPPLLQKVVSDISQGEHLIISHVDRFSRNVAVGSSLLANLRDKNVIVHSINDGVTTDTPSGIFIFHTLLATSQFQSELSGQKSRQVRTMLRSKITIPEEDIPTLKQVATQLHQGCTPNKATRLLRGIPALADVTLSLGTPTRKTQLTYKAIADLFSSLQIKTLHRLPRWTAGQIRTLVR